MHFEQHTELEIVDSLDDFESSRSIKGTQVPNFEMLDARIAPSREGQIGGRKAQKEDWLLRGRQIAHMICDHIQAIGARDYADPFSITLRNDDVQEFDTSRQLDHHAKPAHLREQGE